MQKELNVATLCRNISNKLVDSKQLLEILEEICDGDAKSYTIISILKNNVISAFCEIEECRHKICIIDE